MKLHVQCAKCNAEREHLVSFDEKTAANVTVTASCQSCGNTIILPITGGAKGGLSVTDRLKMAINLAAHRRKIVKGND